MQRVQVKKSDSNATLNDDVSERRVSKAFMQMLDTNATKIQRWFRKTRKPRPIKLTPLERRLQRARETREMLLREMQLTTKVEEPCVYEDDFEDLSQASIEEALSQTRLEPRLDPVLQTSGEEKQDRHLYQDTFKTVSDTVVERHLSQERLETISDTVVDKHLTQNTLSALEPSVPELLVSKPVTQKPKESKSTLKSSQLNGRVNPESRVEENPKSAAIYRSKPSAKPSTKPAVVRKSASAVIKPSEPKPVKKPAKSMEKLVEKPSAISVSPVILSPVAHKSALSEMDNPPVSPLRDAPELGSQEFSTEPRSQEIVRDIGSQEVVEDLESSQLDRNPVKDQETVPQAIEKETSDAEDMDALNQTLMEMEQLQLNNHQTLQDKSSPVPSLGKFSVHVDDASETASTVSYKRSEKSAPRSIHLSKPPSVDITPRESKGTKPPQRYIGSAASESHYSSHYQDSNHTDETSKRVERILDLLKSAEQTQVPELQKPVNVDYLLQEKPPGSDVFEGVKQKLMTQQMELEDKNQIIQTLHLKIEKLKSNQHEMQSAHQKTLKSQLQLQRKEYETIVKRHLSFIDKVLAEKDELTQKCQLLSDQVKNLEKDFTSKQQTMKEVHEREIKNQRELWQAAEKIKRDKWIQDKTKAIKEATIKGLEPEIQNLIAQHKIQLRQAEENYRQQLSKEKQFLMEQQQRQLEAYAEKATSDRQKACEEEREFARQRYQKQLERDEMEFAQQKRKMMAEFDDQKHHLTESFKIERMQDETSHKRQIQDLQREMDQMRSDREKALEDARKRHLQELQQQREKLTIEREEWQSQYIKKIENEVKTREKAFKEKLIKERDAEIEMVIQRLESETDSSRSDVSRSFRMEIQRLKTESSQQMKQLRDQHSLALDKILNLQNQLGQLEQEKRNVQKQVLGLEHQLQSRESLVKQQKDDLDRLRVNEDVLATSIRREFEEALDAKEKAVQQFQELVNTYQMQVNTLKQRYEQQMQQIVTEKDQAMQQVEDKIMQTLTLKDNTIHQLKSQLDAQIQRVQHLEQLIEKQRREFLQ